MTEFIINSDQLERLIEAVEHDTKRPVNEVIIKGVRLSELVRCRDCMYAVGDAMYCTEGCCDESEYRNVEPDGFCAWGERK